MSETPELDDRVADRGAQTSQPVFTPARLGPIELRNRVIKCGTNEGMARGGEVTDRLLEWHRAFAAGGVGLANLTSDDAGAGAAQTTVTGSDWSQAERQPAIAPAVGGSDWSQAERPAAASADGSGSAWTQDERPGTATTGT